jgi:UDP-2,3-diacylglucosamine hydrolase
MEKNIYFLSDFHLGAPDASKSLEREKKIVRFLRHIQPTAAEIFILGDMFDFWYEYKTVVPKGYSRILGALADITDAGIPVHFFVGNHDMWMNGFFEAEFAIPVYHEPKQFERFGKKLYIGHGDGLGPGDHGYKFIKKIFRNPLCNWLFGFAHPSIGMGVANYLSRRSRAKTGNTDLKFLGEENEWLLIYSKEIEAQQHHDYYVFGHRHLPLQLPVNDTAMYMNVGDWINHFTYGVLNQNGFEIKTWEN